MEKSSQANTAQGLVIEKIEEASDKVIKLMMKIKKEEIKINDMNAEKEELEKKLLKLKRELEAIKEVKI